MNFLHSASKSLARESTSTASEKSSAAMVLSTMLGSATDAWEPSMRNSNLLPVKAKGDVRFLSVVSMGKMGDSGTPMEPGMAFFGTYSRPKTMESTMAPS